MHSLFVHYLTANRYLGYTLIFIGLIFEGDAFLLMTAFLTSLGFFDLFDMLAIVLASAISGDTFWYWIGLKIGGSDNRLGHWLLKKIASVNINFENSFLGKLILSKFLYGTHHVALASLGYAKMPYRKFIKNDIPAAVVWVLVVGGLGYLFASSFQLLKHYVKYVEIGALGAAAVYIAVEQIFKARVKKKSGK